MIIMQAPYRAQNKKTIIPTIDETEGLRITRATQTASKKSEQTHTRKDEYLRTARRKNIVSSGKPASVE
jgi:hypothetical protein